MLWVGVEPAREEFLEVTVAGVFGNFDLDREMRLPRVPGNVVNEMTPSLGNGEWESEVHERIEGNGDLYTSV